MNDSILITGGCGFVGSNLSIHLKKIFPSSRVVALDNLKRKGSELNLSRLREAGVTFVHGDIRNKEDLENIKDVSVVIDAAAEPSVLSGINSSPDYVVNTNLIGTLNCLHFAMQQKARFIFLSTSRIYPIESLNKVNYTEKNTRFELSAQQPYLGITEKGISEEFPVQGSRSFYGSSKFSSELFIEEYNAFYGLQSVVNRCGVITGPWQIGKVDQGVVVLWLSRHFWKKELTYFGFGGEGKQVRDILHISDLCDLITLQLQKFELFQGKTFNVGGSNAVSVSLNELSTLCAEITGNKIQVHSQKDDRTADIPIYITDNSKINSLSGWSPRRSVKDTLADIHRWIESHNQILEPYLK